MGRQRQGRKSRPEVTHVMSASLSGGGRGLPAGAPGAWAARRPDGRVPRCVGRRPPRPSPLTLPGTPPVRPRLLSSRRGRHDDNRTPGPVVVLRGPRICNTRSPGPVVVPPDPRRTGSRPQQGRARRGKPGTGVTLVYIRQHGDPNVFPTGVVEEQSPLRLFEDPVVRQPEPQQQARVEGQVEQVDPSGAAGGPQRDWTCRNAVRCPGPRPGCGVARRCPRDRCDGPQGRSHRA